MPQLFNYTCENRSGVGLVWRDKPIDFSRAWDIWRAAENRTDIPPIASLDAMIAQHVFSGEQVRRVMECVTLGGERMAHGLELKGELRFAPPVLRPGKILGLVRNYKKHAEEFDAHPPEHVIFFAKFPSTVIGHDDVIRFPGWLNSRVDHEVELGVVIGERCRYASLDTAMRYVAGYTIINDVSARHLQKQAMESGMPWTAGKNIDTFCPMGPYLVPRDAIEHPQKLELFCRVNGALRQSSTTENMIFPVAKIISDISRSLTLEPGDVIATGTPEGVDRLAIGDKVECEIPGIGVLANRVVGER